MKTMPSPEIHVDKFKSKGVDIPKKMKLFTHAGRAKFCKKDSRCPPLCTKREATSGKNLKKHLKDTQKVESEIHDLILKLDTNSETLKERKSCCCKDEAFVSYDNFPILLNSIGVQRQTKRSVDVLQEATINDCWIMHGVKVTVRTLDRCDAIRATQKTRS